MANCMTCFRSKQYAFIAQAVERIHGKDEVTSSILVKGSTIPGKDPRDIGRLITGRPFCMSLKIREKNFPGSSFRE